MPASYPRKYYSTSYETLNSIPLVEGNVIALSDTDGFYYDIGNPAGSGSNVERRKASSVKYIAQSALANYEESETIFVVNTGTGLDSSGNTIQLYSGYIWDTASSSHVEIFNNSTDFQVKSVSDDSTKAYIVGSIASTTDIGTLIKNPNIYITSTGNKIHADLEGTADVAAQSAYATTAGTATSAEYDNESTPNKISSYLHDVSSNASTNLGSTITFTLGDGTSKPIRVSDTTYQVFTSSTDGLVPRTSTTVVSDSTGLVLSGSGWISETSVPSGSAIADGAGNVITETYYADASFDVNTKDLTLTTGDGNHVTVLGIPYVDTVFNTSDAGLVPTAPSSDASIKFLKGDATWGTITTYQGASAGSAGVAGLVPAASSGDTEKFLRSDGNWGSTFTSSADGLVPKTSSANSADILSAAGSWVAQNSTGSTNDASNTLYLVGALTQSSSAQTYSNTGAYTNSGKLYSNSLEVVNLSDTQALTNKTYEGYTLGDACAKTISTSLTSSSPSANVPTNGAVIGYVSNEVDSKVDVSLVAALYDDTSTSYAVGDYCMYDDGNGFALYKCNTAISSPAGSFDSTKWDDKLITELDTWLSGTLTAGQTSVTISNAAIKVGSMLEIYTDVYGLQPANVTVTTGQIVLTFVAQGSNVNVKVKVI